MSAMVGSYFSFGNLMSPLVSPYGLSVQQIALGGGMSSFLGIFGIIGGGIFIDKTKIFRKTLIVLALAGAFNLFIFTTYSLPRFYINDSNFVILAINMSFIGFLLMPALPICMTLATEVTYPMHSSLSNGICQLASAAASSVLSLVGAWMLSTDASQGVTIE